MSANEYTGTTKYNKHLTLEERITISSLIESNRNEDCSLKIKLKNIGEILHKDPTTISKEVKRSVELFVYKKRDYKYTNCYSLNYLIELKLIFTKLNEGSPSNNF